MTRDAIDIYQAHLDVSTRHVFAGESEAYADHAQLPFVFRTAQGVEVIETTADLAADIGRLCQWLRSQNVSDYHRIAREARFLDDETIEGFHITYALRGATPVIEPYASRMILKRAGGMWKTSFAEHELADALYPRHNAKASHGIFSQRWTGGRFSTVHDPAVALPLYTRVVSRIAETASGDVFPAWQACYTMPYTVHYDEGDYTVAAPGDGRVFWDILKQVLARHGADRLNVRPTSAVFLTDDRLLGYHDATLLRDGKVVLGPVHSRMIMVLRDGRWLCTSVANTLSMSAFQDGAFVPTKDLPTMREIQQRTKK